MDTQESDQATSSAQDDFMNVVQKAAATLQPEKYAKKAWIVLDRDAHPRKACIAVVEWPWFDRIVMVLIVLNCATMALFTDPILTAKMHQATRRSATLARNIPPASFDHHLPPTPPPHRPHLSPSPNAPLPRQGARRPSPLHPLPY